MAQIIKIKRSVLTATPSSLAEGEMAHSEVSEKLFIGASGSNIWVIGGKSYVDKVDGIEAGAEVNVVTSVASKTGDVTLDKDDVGLSNVDNVQQIPLAQKGANSGVAELDSGGKVPSSQLPSYVDDIEEYADFASLPATGESGKLYVTLDDNAIYRWSGTVYVQVASGDGALVLGETSSTAYRGDRGKDAYDHSLLISGNPHSVSKADVGLGNVDNTSDANKPISTAVQTALDGKSDTSHDHSGTYEPADSTILKDADIGVTVQAYNANYVIDASYVHTDNNFTTVLLNKLNGIDAGANDYTHPATHPPSIIAETIDDKFVSDTQISNWDAKLGPTSTIDGGTF